MVCVIVVRYFLFAISPYLSLCIGQTDVFLVDILHFIKKKWSQTEGPSYKTFHVLSQIEQT